MPTNSAVPTAAPTNTIVPTSVPTNTAVPQPTDGSEQYALYTIRRGETLAQLAQRFNTTVRAIVTLNTIANPDSVLVGTVLRIPRSQA